MVFARLPRWIRLLLCFSLPLLLVLSIDLAPGWGISGRGTGTSLMLSSRLSAMPKVEQVRTPQRLAQAGQQEYRAGNLAQAEVQLRQALQQYQAEDNPAGQAMVLGNLALVLGQQGQWSNAEAQLQQSLKQAQLATNRQQATLSAQLLNIQGRLQLAQGDAAAAARSWNESAIAYQTQGNVAGEIRSRLRQARAIQALGFYEKAAREILQPLKQQIDALPDSSTKAAGLLDWGESQATIGSLREAQRTLRESLAVARRVDDGAAIAAAQLSLANALWLNMCSKELPCKRAIG